jgi:hypothetical protein
VITFDAVRGFDVHTIKLDIDYYGENIGNILLVPHSVEMYEIHISSLNFNKNISPRVSVMEAINIFKEALHFGFTYMDKLQKVIAMIPLSNTFAIFAAKRVGMSFEGVLKKGHLFENQMIDIEIYSLDRGDL